VAGFAATSGFDRDRAFYPTVLIVIASYYSLFAVMGASRYSTLEIEIAVGLVFSVFAVLGFKKSMWLAAAGIANRTAAGERNDHTHGCRATPAESLTQAGFPHRSGEEQQNILNRTRKERL
jgi:hypothetical protein